MTLLDFNTCYYKYLEYLEQIKEITLKKHMLNTIIHSYYIIYQCNYLPFFLVLDKVWLLLLFYLFIIFYFLKGLSFISFI